MGNTTTHQDIRAFLDRKVDEYNRPSFITDDPISIPRGFVLQQDIEISGFFAAIFSWGNRTTIIKKTRLLMQLMDNAPYQFILQHKEKDLIKLLDFRHRTFNATDLLYFIAFFRHHYTNHASLEEAFLRTPDHLSGFYHYFFSLESAPPRTYKHIATPEKNSSCKRLNMFLRWMVRNDDRGVDFGIWKKIPAARLICPLDVHVARVARRFGLMTRTQTDWQAALELTDYLITLDPSDPVKYDFALFGLGVMEKF
ncbi:MAG: TIGR02757 family protein [Chitinophagaceae bacterium]|nr:TIGR02757 family protein [Chitinophagaceae bacterium]